MYLGALGQTVDGIPVILACPGCRVHWFVTVTEEFKRRFPQHVIAIAGRSGYTPEAAFAIIQTIPLRAWTAQEKADFERVRQDVWRKLGGDPAKLAWWNQFAGDPVESGYSIAWYGGYDATIGYGIDLLATGTPPSTAPPVYTVSDFPTLPPEVLPPPPGPPPGPLPQRRFKIEPDVVYIESQPYKQTFLFTLENERFDTPSGAGDVIFRYGNVAMRLADAGVLIEKISDSIARVTTEITPDLTPATLLYEYKGLTASIDVKLSPRLAPGPTPGPLPTPGPTLGAGALLAIAAIAIAAFARE